MNSSEKELVTRFLQQLASAHAGPKDSEADALIRDAVARQPDAAYLLVQRAIQLEQLLAASQAEVQRLQSQATPAAATASGFLGDPNAWGRNAAVNPAQGAAPGSAAPHRPPQKAAATAQAAPGSAWGSGLFGNIATTAAGVVAGSFLYQGIQGLMNRKDENTPLAQHQPQHHEPTEDPESLNTFDTPPADSGSDMADSGDSSDFA